MGKLDYAVMKQILDDEVEYYTDILNPENVFVEYPRANGALCFEPIESKSFAAFLGCRYRELVDEDVKPNFSSMLSIRAENAIHWQDNAVKIHKRVAGSLDTKIRYFLADADHRIIVVTPKGWAIKRPKKVKFLKYATDDEQVEPIGGGSYLDLMLPYLNLPRDDALLYAVFIVQGFSRNSSHYAAIISSCMGSGKSTLTRTTCALLDPTKASCALQPSSADNLKTLLANSYVASFDNTSSLTRTDCYSDILCAAITGSTEAKRKLFSDCDQIILNLHNLIILNGIDVCPSRGDLVDRSLLFEPLAIPEGKRKTDAEIRRQFKHDRPLILGAIFDTLVKAMTILPTVEVRNPQRMLDAQAEMIAIALALGIKQEDFERMLINNRQKLKSAYADDDPFLGFMLSYLKIHQRIDEPVSTLYTKLLSSYVGDRKSFPNSASALSRKLSEFRKELWLAGYQFERSKTSTHNRIKISRVPKNQLTKAQKDAAYRASSALNASI